MAESKVSKRHLKIHHSEESKEKPFLGLQESELKPENLFVNKVTERKRCRTGDNSKKDDTEGFEVTYPHTKER